MRYSLCDVRFVLRWAFFLCIGVLQGFLVDGFRRRFGIVLLVRVGAPLGAPLSNCCFLRPVFLPCFTIMKIVNASSRNGVAHSGHRRCRLMVVYLDIDLEIFPPPLYLSLVFHFPMFQLPVASIHPSLQVLNDTSLADCTWVCSCETPILDRPGPVWCCCDWTIFPGVFARVMAACRCACLRRKQNGLGICRNRTSWTCK